MAISNERILGMDGSRVRFQVRDSVNDNRKKVVRLEAGEFIKRFMLHVLPGGFKRTVTQSHSNHQQYWFLQRPVHGPHNIQLTPIRKTLQSP